MTPVKGPGSPEDLSSFSTLVVSLATSAMMYLGDIPDPEGGKPAVHLDLARHTIDTLSMLHEKTKGNLTAEEEALLRRFLHDLRVRFVSLAK